jgi:hypothetical protein
MVEVKRSEPRKTLQLRTQTPDDLMISFDVFAEVDRISDIAVSPSLKKIRQPMVSDIGIDCEVAT